MSKRFILKQGLFVLVVIIFGLLINLLWVGPKSESARYVHIPPKAGAALISQKLADANIVRSGSVFRIYAMIKKKAHLLKAGEYEIKSRATLNEVLQKLVSGDVVTHAITIPEGYTVRQIAKKLAQAGLVEEDVFISIAQDPSTAKALGVPADSVEGFLFPDTYRFTKGMAAEQIAGRMVKRFHEKIEQKMIDAGQKQGLDFLKLITLASIIEREVRVSKERPMVASVFYNRMQKRMRLESCATVLYSQNRISGTLSLEDLQTKSPYNTYRKRGLPPGPISNPGLSAIEAAAYPADTNYLFFVVRPDGEHVFSQTFKEHKRAKWQQKKVRRNMKK